jgi:hypothetical protein
LETGTPISLDTLDKWESWVAVGTLTLALATAWLAKSTRSLAGTTKQEVDAFEEQLALTREEVEAVKQQAKVARDQILLSSQALQASNRPLLVDVPIGIYLESITESSYPDLVRHRVIDRVAVSLRVDKGDLKLNVPFRNSGTGLALIQRVALLVEGEETPATVAGTAVGPGEFTRVNASRAGLRANVSRLNIIVWYTDLGGAQSTRSQLEFAIDRSRDGHQEWRVRALYLFRDIDKDPFAQSGPFGDAEMDFGVK